MKNNANFDITLESRINMKGEVSIPNWYLEDPKQSHLLLFSIALNLYLSSFYPPPLLFLYIHLSLPLFSFSFIQPFQCHEVPCACRLFLTSAILTLDAYYSVPRTGSRLNYTWVDVP